MIVTDTYPKPERPVIVDLRTALGEAIDRQQVAIVREYLDAVAEPLTDENRCACCAIRHGGHGHFAQFCPECAERPAWGCDHGFGA